MSESQPQEGRRSRWWVPAGAVAVVVALVGAIVLQDRGGSAQPEEPAVAAAILGTARPGATAQAGRQVSTAGAAVRIVAGTTDPREYRDVPLRIRTAASDPRLEVTMHGRGGKLRDVTDRFERVGTGVYAGTLRAGKELGIGDNVVYAASRRGDRGTATRSIVLATPSARPLDLSGLDSEDAEHAPLEVTAKAPGDLVHARLNGVAAGDAFVQTTSDRWAAHLTPKNGLRAGSNRLIVTVYDRDKGSYRRALRTFEVSKDRPLVDAGHDHIAREGSTVTLDGSRTEAGQAGRTVAMKWAIVQKPAGSHARLLDPTAKRPRLVTDRRGHYQIALRAQHVGGGPGKSAVRTSATATDTVAVDATPDLPPIGARLQTMVAQGETVGITLDGQSYAMPDGAVVQMLVVDRKTLEVTANKGYASGQESTLTSDLAAVKHESLVVLSGGGRSYAAPQPVQAAIGSIGGTLASQAPVGVLSDLTGGTGRWSVVGSPGLPAGQAYQLIGVQQGAGAPVGAIDGWVTLGSDGSTYTFGWRSEHHTFDTGSAHSATSNQMTVDGQTYDSWNLPFAGKNVTDGYQFLWFDADTLTLRATATYATNLDNTSGDGANAFLRQLRITGADAKPGLILINTIGTVTTPYFEAKKGSGEHCDGANSCPTAGSDGNGWGDGGQLARAAMLLQGYGANPHVFVMAGHDDGTSPGVAGGYSLVGVSGLHRLKGPNAGAELSTRMYDLYDTATSRLTGELTRSRQGILTASAPQATDPGEGGQPAVVVPGLGSILAQPDQPFTPLDTPGEKAAVSYIASQLDLSPDDTYGIRGLYWLEPNLGWGSLANQLHTTPVCTDEPCAGAYAAVEKTLESEFRDVGDVVAALTATGAYADIIHDAFLQDGAFFSPGVAGTVRKYYDPPLTALRGPDALGILSGSLGIVGAIGEFVPIAGEEVAAAAEMGASISDIVAASGVDHDTGESVFDPYGFNTTVTGIDAQLQSALSTTDWAFGQARDVIVSDAGRLAAAAALARRPASSPQGGWQLSTPAAEQVQAAMLQRGQQFIWLALGQPVFATYECAAEDIAGVAKHNPAAVLATNVPIPPMTSPDLNFIPNRVWNTYPTSIVLARRNHWGWPQPVDSRITSNLFGDDGVGLSPEYVMAPALAQYASKSGNEYDKPLTPTSSGLLRKTMNMWASGESGHGLGLRVYWSMYTPSCGWGQRLRWSSPDAFAPDSYDPVASQGGTGTNPDGLWDPGGNPFRGA